MPKFIAAALASAALAFPAAAETIRVGMSGGYFPFTFVRQDVLQGFEVDFMNAIAAETGDEVAFETMSFSGLVGALEAGRIDTIANQITITPEREAAFVFSQPYVYDGAQVVVREGNDTRSPASRTCAARASPSTSARTSRSCCARSPTPTRSTSAPTRATSSRTPRSAASTPS